MPDIWLDTVTPKISIAIHSLLPELQSKGYSTVVTAKEATQTTNLLDLLKVPYYKIGEYGETPKEKLIFEQKRTIKFTELFDKIGTPKVLWTHGDVSAIRTAFGLKIPVIYANDTLFAYHVAKLVTSLVDWLIAPISFGKSWSKFGIQKNRIILYDGLEEIAWLNTNFESHRITKQLEEKKPIILFRDAEYQASYFGKVEVDSYKLLKELTKLANVVYLPRYGKEKQKIRDLQNLIIPKDPILTAQIIPHIDLMIGSGGTACRETALSGIPTINFHFWDVQARYLAKRNFPIKIIKDQQEIVKLTKNILENPEKFKVNTKPYLSKMESPLPIWTKYIENCISNAKYRKGAETKEDFISA